MRSAANSSSEIIKIAAKLARREGMPDDLPEHAFNLLGKLSIDLRNAYDDQQKYISVIQKKADALEHWRQEVGKLHSKVSTLLECLKDARRLLTDQDAIDLVHIDEVISKAEGTALAKAGVKAEMEDAGQ